MELINNRYKVDKLLNKDAYEDYLVRDSLDNNKEKNLRIFDGNKHRDLIEYYLDEFLWLRNIKHRRLLDLEAFRTIETINLKPNELPLYYVISEKLPETTLDQIYEDLDFQERIKIIQQLISIIDYLHFRGFAYKFLDPKKIFYSKEEGIRLLNINALVEYSFSRRVDPFNVTFVSPSVLLRNNEANISSDYYSIAMIMKYLLLENYQNSLYIFKEDLEIGREYKEKLQEIIQKLASAYRNNTEISLVDVIDDLNELCNEKFVHKFKEEREHLHLKTKMVGRDRELEYVKGIDERILNNSLDFNGLMFKGISGVGKTRLLKDIGFRLRMWKRNVYMVNVDQALSFELDIIRIFLNIITDNREDRILSRYRNSFYDFIPEKFGGEEYSTGNKDIQRIELYKLFSSICNYLKEISLPNPVYILIDNINNYNKIFIQLIDYLLQSLFNSKVFIIFTYDKINGEKSFCYYVEKWIEEGYIKESTLNNLTKDDISLLTKNILGISFTPVNFSTVLYEASKGNPRFLDLAIKEIFRKKELFIANSGKWHSEKDNFSYLSIPTDFRKIIIKQTKDITGDKLKVLKVISISNDSMSKFLIFNMLNLDMVELNDIINSLLNEQILVERNYRDNFYYGFLSSELKATVYYDMGEDEKRQLHMKLADLLLLHKPGTIRDLIEETVYHLIKANLKTEAIDLIVQEARKIDNIYSDRAVLLWEMGFSIAKNIEHKEKIYILDMLTKINLHKTNLEKFNLYLIEFKKEAIKLNNSEYIIKAHNYEADIYLRTNQNENVNKIINDIRILSFQNNNEEGVILSYILKIRLLNKDTEVDRAYVKEMLDTVLDLSERYNIKTYLGQIYLLYGLFHYLNGNKGEAITNYENSIKYLEKNGEVYDAIKAINNLGNVCLEETGNIDRCFSYFHQGLEITNKYGFTYLETIFQHNLGAIYLNMLELEKAKEYSKKAIKLANTIRDNNMIFMSNCNLGRMHLLSNEYDKAYKIYLLLNNMVQNEKITDTEILIAYRNFLGTFYFIFGNYDLAIKYSKLASGISYGFSEIDYFISTFRIFHIEYINGSINKYKFYDFLNKFNGDKLNRLVRWKLKFLVLTSLLKNDFAFAKKLMEYYDETSHNSKLEEYKWLAELVGLSINYSKANLQLLEEKVMEVEKKAEKKINYQLYLLIAKASYSKADYKIALKYYIKAFDSIYSSMNTIDDRNLRYSFLLSTNAQGIKAKIYEILNKHYSVEIHSKEIQNFEGDNFYSYFDLTPVINSLNNDDINDIIGYEDDGIRSLDELLSSFGPDYIENIKRILKFLSKVTLAKRGFVINLNNGIIDLEKPIASLVEGDNKLPNEMILYQSLRQETGFIYNCNNSHSINLNRYSPHIPENVRGIICIPILSRGEIDSNDLGIHDSGKEENLFGYIYLETDNALNRFDEEGVKLAFALSKLIYLNLENEKLRLNSTTDRMTSVYTRKYFETKFDSILELYKVKQGELSVLMIDLDGFKGFNDRYGHLKGDEILAEVGNSIKNIVATDGMVGRYGGEEFIVLLWDCSIDKAIVVGEKIRKTIKNISVPGVENTITASIGLAQYPLHGSYRTDLINCADQALYYAKKVLHRNSIAVWHKDLQNTSLDIDKNKGIVTGNLDKDNRNILQLMDIAESIKENTHIVGKIYQFLSSIISISNCEYATYIDYGDEENPKYYTRKRKSVNWVEANKLHMNLINKVYHSKIGLFTIDWHDEGKDFFHVPDWDSVLVAPVIKQANIKGIIYITVPLKEKEFNQETMNLINVFANIFSGNY